MWFLIFIIAAVALSLLLGGGINWQFLKVLVCFLVGFVAILAAKKLFDLFNRNDKR